MASRNFTQPAFDPTSVVGEITKAQFLQLFKQIAPEADIGWILSSEDTPDVATYAEYETFFWIKPSTGEVKYWNGLSWQLIFTQPALADGSVGIAKLAVGAGLPGQIIRVNIGGDNFEFIDPEDLFGEGGIPINRLEEVEEGDFLLAVDGTKLVPVNFAEEFLSALAGAQLPFSQITDLDGQGEVNQVPYLAEPNGQLGFNWADQLLRANQVLSNRIKFAAGLAGKTLAVNASGTDFQAAVNTSNLSAVLTVSLPATTNGQTVNSGNTDIVVFNTADDPNSLLNAFDSGTGEFTLNPGTYDIHAIVPVRGTTPVQVQLYDVTNDAVSKHSCFDIDELTPIPVSLLATLVVTAATEFAIRLSAKSANVVLGNAADMNSLGEVHSQLRIIKRA